MEMGVDYKTMQEINSKGAENTLFTNFHNREPLKNHIP